MLNIYSFQQVEGLIQKKISEQSLDQLKQLQGTLEELMGISYKSLLLLEQDETIKDILADPSKREPLVNKHLMESKFKSIENSFFLITPQVYFTFLDFNGNAYTSYQPQTALDYETIIEERWYQDLINSNTSYSWTTDDRNYVHRDISTSAYLLSLYALIRDEQLQPNGVARISLDFTYWFKSAIYNSPVEQEYFIFTRNGELISSSVLNSDITIHKDFNEIGALQQDGFYIDHDSAYIVNYSYMPSTDWYIMNRIPLNILFTEINMLKKQYLIAFVALIITFIVMTFLISATITKPLYHLQKKMKEAANKGFQVRLPEHKYKGEILHLTKSFNQMLDDLNHLIKQLKIEERQKEAIKVQMLLAQVNPHFLLNTLNTIKWIAVRNENRDITDICLSLGKLLEASLNTESELIHLKDEVHLVEAYVYIQQFRFDNKFEVQYDIDPTVEYALIPKLSLQPLVENALIHGFSEGGKHGLITIKAKALEDKLIVEVADNGIGPERSKQKRSIRKRDGIGLKNIRERLKLLFRDEGELQLVALQEGALVTFNMPLLLSFPYEQGGQVHVEGIAR